LGDLAGVLCPLAYTTANRPIADSKTACIVLLIFT
jgi:hypothetical protein